MGRLLSPQRLAAIARRWEQNMDATCVVLPQTQVDIGGGGTDLRYPLPTQAGLTTWKCRLQPASAPDEAVVSDQTRARIWWEVQLPTGSRIVPSDRLYVTGVDAKRQRYTRTIEVAGPSGPRAWEAVRIVRGWEVLPDTPTTTG